MQAFGHALSAFHPAWYDCLVLHLSRCRVFGLATLLAAMLMSSSVAQSQECGCGVCPSRGGPFLNMRTVSQNARFFARLDRYDPASVALTDTTGATLDISLEPAGDSNGTAYWIVPATLLPVGNYTLRAIRGGRASTTEEFSVTEGLSSTPPILSEVTVSDRSGPIYCEPLTGVAVDWMGVGAAGPFVLEVEVWRGPVLLGRAFPTWDYSSTEVGSSTWPECFGSAHVPGIEADDQLTLQARVWDTSGNPSPLREIAGTARRYPGEPDCAHWCSATPGRAQPSAASLITVAALGGLCLARRRRAKARG